MKTIQLEIKLHKNKKYTLHIERCKFLEFRSKTFQKEWLVRYKKLINDNVKSINIFLPQLYQLYRLYYFHFDTVTTYRLNSQFDDINHRFDYIFKIFSLENQSYFTFSNIENVIAMLSDVGQELKEFANKHKIYALKHQVAPLLKMLYNLEERHLTDKVSLSINDSYQTKPTLKLIKSLAS